MALDPLNLWHWVVFDSAAYVRGQGWTATGRTADPIEAPGASYMHDSYAANLWARRQAQAQNDTGRGRTPSGAPADFLYEAWRVWDGQKWATVREWRSW